MAKTAADQFAKIQQRLAQTLRTLPAIIGEEAVNFSLEAFDREAWNGNTTENWVKRKNPTKWGKADETDRALLIKTGKLKRSIRVTRILNDRVRIGAGGADIPYARIHNYGFSGKVNQNVKAFTRRMQNGKTINVSGFNRTINQRIPKRQFIGGEKDSPFLKQRVKRVIILELKQVMK